MSVGGLLLAAGAGRRFGQPKALVGFHGELLVERGIASLRAGGCAPVHVVLGASMLEVLAQADLSGAVTVSNPAWDSGLSSSLRTGLASIPVDVVAVVVALVDQPLIGPDVVRRLVSAFDDGAQVAVASYGGKRRNPVLLARTVWDAVAEASHGDVGAKAYLCRHPEVITDVDCTDIASDADIDTPDDLAVLLRSPGAQAGDQPHHVGENGTGDARVDGPLNAEADTETEQRGGGVVG